jgi:hypothetical protein
MRRDAWLQKLEDSPTHPAQIRLDSSAALLINVHKFRKIDDLSVHGAEVHVMRLLGKRSSALTSEI